MVADNPDGKIELRMFHAELQNGRAAIKKEEDCYKPLPVVANVTDQDIQENYKRIKKHIDRLLLAELKKLETNEPGQFIKEIQSDDNEPYHAVSM